MDTTSHRCRSSSRLGRLSFETRRDWVSERTPSALNCCGPCSDGRPQTISEELASPSGRRSFAERSNSAAKLTAPQDTTTKSAQQVSRWPSRSANTLDTECPFGVVSDEITIALVNNVTLSCFKAGTTQATCASTLAFTMHGKASQVSQRMQALRCSGASLSMMPTGKANGLCPIRLKSSASSWTRARLLTGGYGNGPLVHGSVGPTPRFSVNMVKLFRLGIVRLDHHTPRARLEICRRGALARRSLLYASAAAPRHKTSYFCGRSSVDRAETPCHRRPTTSQRCCNGL